MYNIAFIVGSKIRKKILSLTNKPKTVKRISNEMNKHVSSVSREMRAMEKKKLVICLNPKDDRTRFYQTTKKGKDILKKVKELEK